MEEYKKWLDYAEEDLNWANVSLRSGVYYGACFAAQQSVEKSLKGFLFLHKKPSKKTHDVLVLPGDCIRIDKDFEKLRTFVNVVVPYYIGTRYPDLADYSGFDDAKAREACDSARHVIDFIKSRF
ncbi:HEPN domain-containing protein [Candidatus Curtissbacteria bacterium]|nr:HEPN domain-containing protein [Candidatus Curtissbacteria bacterium]